MIIKITNMKKITIIIAFLIANITCFSQNKNKPVCDKKSLKDTTITGYNVIVILDSTEYSNIMKFLGTQPIGAPGVRYVYSLMDGSLKNLELQPIFSIHVKKP